MKTLFIFAALLISLSAYGQNCTTRTDCSRTAPTCLDGTCRQSTCSLDSDCTNGDKCRQHTCIAFDESVCMVEEGSYITCNEDEFCDFVNQECVPRVGSECTTNAECTDSKCIGGRCREFECRNHDDCGDRTTFCDYAGVQDAICINIGDSRCDTEICSPSEECINGTCEAKEMCLSNEDCEGAAGVVCDPETRKCVDLNKCGDTTCTRVQSCVANSCEDIACGNDDDCVFEGGGVVCDPQRKVCVEESDTNRCGNSICGSHEECVNNVCKLKADGGTGNTCNGPCCSSLSTTPSENLPTLLFFIFLVFAISFMRKKELTK